jgi:hypothetical protein
MSVHWNFLEKQPWLPSLLWANHQRAVRLDLPKIRL